MLLILFDIDGTLTDTYGVDADCFVRALHEEFDIADVDTNWTNYPDATDSAIFDHIVRTRLKRPPCDEDTNRMKRRFMSLLEDTFGVDATRCQPIVGSVQLLKALELREDCATAMATGGWECSARLKLRCAGIEHDRIPLASSDDSMQRTEICNVAVDRARHHYGCQDFHNITYVGDGVWDAQAARQLGYRFIGRGSDPSQFEDYDPVLVISDFTDARLLGLLSN